MAVDDSLDNVLHQLVGAGLQLDDGSLEFSRLVRCRVEGDKGGKRSGWYVIHPLTLDNGRQVYVGRYGNWRIYGDESLKIDFVANHLSDRQMVEIRRQQEVLREQAETERLERQREAMERAAQIWQALPESGSSEYLDRKQVRAYGLRFSRGSVVVPVRNIDGQLLGLQFIAPDGTKKFLTGTAKRGAFHLVGPDSPAPPSMWLGPKTLWLAEGYATAATVHMATRQAVAVAFDAGNLLPVAQALRSIWPDTRIAIAADNDTGTEGNPGVTKAREAALAVGGVVAIPEFEAVS